MDKIAQSPLLQLVGWTVIFGGLLLFIAVLRWSKSAFVAFLVLITAMGAGAYIFIAGTKHWQLPTSNLSPSVEKLFLQLASQVDHRQKKRRSTTQIPKVRLSDLVVVSSSGDITKVRALLERGVNPNTRNPSGISALEVAAQSGHAEVVKVLVSFGAEVNARGLLGTTPLMLASGRGHIEIVRFLIASGADVNVKSDMGNTALKMAEMGGHTAVVEFLTKCLPESPDI